MKKNSILFVLWLISTAFLPARLVEKDPPPDGAIWLPAFPGSTEYEPNVAVISRGNNELELEITFSGIWATPFQTENGLYTQLSLQPYGHLGEYGQPDLPIFTVLSELPGVVPIRLAILTSSYTTVTLQDYGLPKSIYPLQPPVPKNDTVPPWVSPDAAVYEKAQFLPANAAILGEPYQQRNHFIQPVRLNPVRYNPQSSEIQLLQSVRLRLTWQPFSPSELQQSIRLSDPVFDTLNDGVIQLEPSVNLDGSKDPSPGTGFLIISANEFISDLNPLVTLKHNQGYRVTLVSLADIGSSTTTGIKNYIQKAYDTWEVPPSYILFIGDNNTIPAWQGKVISKKTDLYYSTMNGSTDYIPDIYYGRLPARTSPQLIDMISKIITYANYDGSQPWIKKASFIGSCDSNYYPVAEGSHNYVISSYTQPLGYTGIFPNNPQLGGDKLYCRTYSATTTNILNEINNQRAIVTYSGHGAKTSWSDGNISINQGQISALSNTNAFALVTSFACETGDFANDSTTESFGETWLYQPQKGAVIYLGSADFSYWSQDDILERNLFDTLFLHPNEPPSISQAVFAGLDKVNDIYPGNAIGSGQYYFESYNILGDPSTQIWLGPRPSDFSLEMADPNLNVCSSGTAQSLLQVHSLAGFSSPVTVGLPAMPVNLESQVSPNPVNPGSSTTISISAGQDAIPGSYDVQVQAVSGSLQHSLQMEVSVANITPSSPSLELPLHRSTNVSLQPMFTWQSAEQAAEYRLQVALDSDFTKIVIDQTHLRSNSYSPVTPLESATFYYWRVSTLNGCGESSFSSVFNFSTLSLPGDCSILAETQTLYANDFEGLQGGWQSSGWLLNSSRYISPVQGYNAVAPEMVSDKLLASPAILIPELSLQPTLHFWQWRNLEAGTTTCLDGGILEYSTNSGSSWSQVPADWFPRSEYTYDGLVSSAYNNPLHGKPAWCGSEDWQKVVVDLSALSEQSAQFRYRMGSDSSMGSEGWYVDDFSVQFCQEAYRFTLSSDALNKSQEAGMNVTYALLVENNGLTDSYLINASGNSWNVSIMPSEVSDLGYNQTVESEIRVSIPADANLGDQDSVTITVSSLSAPGLQHSILLTTSVVKNYYIYLPLISK